MKFPIVKSYNPKIISIKNFDGGLNKSTDNTRIEDNCLADCKNIYYDENKLKTRPGLVSDENKCLKSSVTNTTFYSDFRVSDTKVFLDNKCYHIAIEYAETGLADYYASMFLIDNQGNQTYTGSLHFRRTSDAIFYNPSNITFYQGKPITGKGIFALVTLNNIENYTDKLHEIYEINTSLNSWIPCTSYYVPTVFINGRGDSYEKAEQSGQAFSEKPTALEPLNLLNGKFISYFSSDAFSSSFRLPFNSLDDNTVTCRIYHTPNSYVDWTVEAGNQTATKTFLNTNVTINVDRNKGIVSFTVASGNFPVPLMSQYKANNIKITAYKTVSDGFEDVVSCTECININSRIILTSGAKKNRVYSARYHNPLYFPLGELTEIGSPSERVTALLPFNDKIIAFKETECYSLSINNGKMINTISLIADNNDTFYNYDKINVSPLNLNIGCKGHNLTTVLGNNAFVYASDSNIYWISKTGEFKCISQKISPLLKQIHDNLKIDSILLKSEKFLICALRNQAFVACLKEDSNSWQDVGWYKWEFPSNFQLIGGFNTDSSPVILCNKSSKIGFFSLLGNNEDILMNTVTESQNHNIESSFTTKNYSDEKLSHKMKLNKIIFNLKTDNKSKIKINGKNENLNNFINKSPNSVGNFIFFPSAASTKSVCINFETKTYFEAGSLEIHYESLIK